MYDKDVLRLRATAPNVINNYRADFKNQKQKDTRKGKKNKI